MIDNCSVHGDMETIPELYHIEVAFLPPKKSSKLQPLDEVIMAAMNVRYLGRKNEHAIDLINVSELYIYKNEILTTINWLSNIWKMS